MTDQNKAAYFWMWQVGHKGAQIFVLISLISFAFPSGPWVWSLVLAGIFAIYFALVVWFGIRLGLVEKTTEH